LADGRLIALPLSRRFPRQLSLIWHKQKYHSTSLRHFIHFCRAQVNDAEVISPD
ncbi:LysR family transcriptional regulator, partial [Aeromonas veronii]